MQLFMIERYGNINRNLDQLLLLSAVSSNLDEQTIALEHMLGRIDSFKALTQFSHCWESLSNSHYEKYKFLIIRLTDKYFKDLPFECLRKTLNLNFDHDLDVRAAAFQLFEKKVSIMPEISQSLEYKRIEAAQKLLNKFRRLSPSIRDYGTNDVFISLEEYIEDFCYPFPESRKESSRNLFSEDFSSSISATLESLSADEFSDLTQCHVDLNLRVTEQIMRPGRVYYNAHFDSSFLWLALTYEKWMSDQKKNVLTKILKDPENTWSIRRMFDGYLEGRISPRILYRLLVSRIFS